MNLYFKPSEDEIWKCSVAVVMPLAYAQKWPLAGANSVGSIDLINDQAMNRTCET